MKFIEMPGSVLRRIVQADEIPESTLQDAGIESETVVRVNQQGDIEVRRTASWEVIGGLLGDFQKRVRSATGLDWA